MGVTICIVSNGIVISELVSVHCYIKHLVTIPRREAIGAHRPSRAEDIRPPAVDPRPARLSAHVRHEQVVHARGVLDRWAADDRQRTRRAGRPTVGLAVERDGFIPLALVLEQSATSDVKAGVISGGALIEQLLEAK